MIVDPMLATGGSADAAITKMKELGCKNIKLMILVAAPEGVKLIYEAPSRRGHLLRCAWTTT